MSGSHTTEPSVIQSFLDVPINRILLLFISYLTRYNILRITYATTCFHHVYPIVSVNNNLFLVISYFESVSICTKVCV